MAINSCTLTQFLALLFFKTAQLTLSRHCTKTERAALLSFKSNLKDPYSHLPSWIGDDCCSWIGVQCNNRTGHVIKLHLRDDTDGYKKPRGTLTPSLLALRHLRHLDLSGCSFEGGPLPEFISSFEYLTYLDLSGVGFSGTVPHQFGNISNLRYLDLSTNYLVDDTDGNTRWLRALGRLDSLVSLSLNYCLLTSLPRSVPYTYFKSLSFLDLGSNHFNSTIPGWVFNLTRLRHLELSGNSFEDPIPFSVGSSGLKYLGLAANSLKGPVPSSIGSLASLNVLDFGSNQDLSGPLPTELGNLCNLQSLTLSYTNLSLELYQLHEVLSGCIKNSLENIDFRSSPLTGTLDWLAGIKNIKSFNSFSSSIYGSIPEFIGRLSSLQTLDLAVNQLNGTISESIGLLSNLVSLSLHENSLTGVLSEAHFKNQAQLKTLDLSSNPLVLDISSDWTPQFQLEYLALGSCRIGLQFPRWLRTQHNLSFLNLSSVGISDTMPNWFWNLTSRLTFLDLSHNQISGKLPDSLALSNEDTLYVDMSHNCFEGLVPELPSNVDRLDLSNNWFSGPIPQSIGEVFFVHFLSLSTNNLSGSIPPSLCKLVNLTYLGISNNHLSGEIPNCWNQSSLLQGLDFSNNKLSGAIPRSICSPYPLMTLHLSNNGLTGEIPSCMRNCRALTTLDLGYNKLTGKIPTWEGVNLPNLRILRLRSNKLNGDIPRQLSQLTRLQILDLADNNLSGVIPRSFGDFDAMTVVTTSMYPILNNYIRFDDYMALTLKGRELAYDELLSTVKIIDVSDNNLSGTIPQELGNLVGLVGLNLSGNHLNGMITDRIGNLSQLQSLDLSRNELSGQIPQSLATLTYLSHLNLSYNLLSGNIPTGNQLQTLDDRSIYDGNLDLCGFPLPKCGNAEEPVPSSVRNEYEKEADGSIWICFGMASGFVVGNWISVWILVFKKSWRETYFAWVDRMYLRLRSTR